MASSLLLDPHVLDLANRIVAKEREVETARAMLANEEKDLADLKARFDSLANNPVVTKTGPAKNARAYREETISKLRAAILRELRPGKSASTNALLKLIRAGDYYTVKETVERLEREGLVLKESRARGSQTIDMWRKK